MSSTSKFVLICCVLLVAGTLIYRRDIAINPALPNDMPADARFLATGYDLEHNERRGTWVACQPDGTGAQRCRVTDARGMVLFQGEYAAVRDAHANPASTIAAPAAGTLHWVNGPAEGGPVPVIPMTDGTLLVPYADRDALIDRWSQHPEEWQAIKPTA